MRKDESSETCPKDKVPATLFLAIRNEDEKVVGMIQLRPHINHPVLSTWGGHIGYSVSPSERRKGYAKEMLRLCVLEAKKLEIQQVLVTCSNKNTAPEKTILANKGIFENEVLHEGTIYKRYWIQCE